MISLFNIHPYMIIIIALVFISIMTTIILKSINLMKDKFIDRMDHIEDRIIERLANEKIQKNLSDEYREYVDATKKNTDQIIEKSAYEKFINNKENLLKTKREK